MRGVIAEFCLSESSRDVLSLLFLVFYLTADRIFVNRLGLPAKFRNLQPAVARAYLNSTC
jgi:hypothetical protein